MKEVSLKKEVGIIVLQIVTVHVVWFSLVFIFLKSVLEKTQIEKFVGFMKYHMFGAW